MSHLGARLSALVDGALDPAQRDRALAHVAGCAACRRDLDAERFVKAAMAASSAPGPTPRLLGALGDISANLPLLFPVHPRAVAALETMTIPAGLRLIPPAGYLDGVARLARQHGATLVRMTASSDAQVFVLTRSSEPIGSRRYWPIFAAAERYGLPVGFHVFGTSGHPVSGAGWRTFQ